MSVWSSELGAGGLVNGDFSQNWAFHTDIEDAPWWQVDLLGSFPLQKIVVHNRLDGCQERARSLKIEISEDESNWTTLHAGLSHFEAGAQGKPLIIPLGGRFPARYVRLSLMERSYFHLSQVEVLVDRDEALFLAMRDAYSLDVKFMREPSDVECYALKSSDERLDGPLIGLAIAVNLAFGNCMLQYINVIVLAKRLGLRYIKISEDDRSKLITLKDYLVIDGLTFVPASERLPVGGVFLYGNFFDLMPFRKVIGEMPSPDEVHVIANTMVKQIFNLLPRVCPQKPHDELSIHIRSGDIFGNWVHPLYVQPPLSYYTLIIRKTVDGKNIKRVKLVFENKLNPVIEPLEEYLRSGNIPFSTQSGTVVDDIVALLNCPYLVFGFGSFGPAVCRLSERIEKVFFFSPGTPLGFDLIPSVSEVIEVKDIAGGYIKPGEWQNTPEQRELMVNYPATNLVFSDAPRRFV
jgi:hypothetical protein